MRKSLFLKGSINFKKYLFLFLILKLTLLSALYYYENSSWKFPVSYQHFFSFQEKSTLLPPEQDIINKKMYFNFKNDLIHTYSSNLGLYDSHEKSENYQGNDSDDISSELESGGNPINMNYHTLVCIHL